MNSIRNHIFYFIVVILLLSGCGFNPTVPPIKTNTFTSLPPIDTFTPPPPTDTIPPPSPTDTVPPPPPTLTFTATPTPTFVPCDLTIIDSSYVLPCEYTIQWGDTYYGLARDFYNDDKFGLKIIEYNRASDGTFIDLTYYEDDKIKLKMFEKENLINPRYDKCAEDCNISDFPCIYIKESGEQYWKVSEACYGVDTYYKFVERNNPYSDEEIVIPNLIVNGALKINQKLEELQFYLELGDYSSAFNLHSESYKYHINIQPGGFNGVFIDQFFGYMCVKPQAKKVTLLNQDYNYWEAVVDIYQCKNHPDNEVSIDINESETLERNVCFIIEHGIWVIDDWRIGTENHCP